MAPCCSLASRVFVLFAFAGDAFVGFIGEAIIIRQHGELNAKDLAWLHVPKAGSSFATVLVAWGCPKLVDDMRRDPENPHAAIAHRFCTQHAGSCSVARSLCSSHVPILDREGPDVVHSWPRSRGNFVAMFRQPEQRHISGYHDKQIMSTFGVAVHHGRYGSVSQYARANAGCVVKLINGRTCSDESHATVDMLEKAKQKVDDGFAFVGITEEWALSVCLFHTMFGGKCMEHEFANLRPGSANRSKAGYNTDVLEGWVDPYDGPLYEHVSATFWSNIESYGVSAASCRKGVCVSAARFFED